MPTELDALFAALADPTRRAMVARLAHGDATVNQLAAPFDLTHQAVSRHVGVLRRCGLISQRVEGQRRPCRLNVDRLAQAESWIAEQRRDWGDRLDGLDAHLAKPTNAQQGDAV
ncbi:ArsR/SmtB family transcription factor [Micropruina sonneratiae]|uniref:ArsR/SmtB family transcription factor n=1 Tax=Micropruina sonneratiae TaxID=2986940 RepID=UPI002226BFEA|nr:metalloregulator ArsR/SmtB family transcription factor [Micropruina sp. KQZ13P-5]MCW3157794.1 metalloregulator ArsR/SmtB family transcription factor [Micropruina sp. KQZ13P-5]